MTMNYRNLLKEKKTIVVKIGTSSLTFSNGRLNLKRIEKLVEVVSEIHNKGIGIVLVTSGSIAVGTGKLGKKKRPRTLPGKQAAASIGQAVLMKIYQKFFNASHINVAQILLTYDVIQEEEKNRNAKNTFAKLLEMKAIPIVNENDSIATDEIEIGDNDRLSAMVAGLCNAELLILLSDIDAMFTADPKKDPDAKRLSIVEEITPEIEKAASGAGSSFGTGGMITKIIAAKMCDESGTDTIIANGDQPEILHDIIEGHDIGTLFVASKNRK